MYQGGGANVQGNNALHIPASLWYDMDHAWRLLVMLAQHTLTGTAAPVQAPASCTQQAQQLPRQLPLGLKH